MKKALINASVASMIYKFNMDNIKLLENLGYKVDVACNFGKENPISKEEVQKFKSILMEKDIKIFDTVCPRKVFAIKKMIKTYRQLKKLIEEEQYDLIHTQSPIGGAICRMACRNARKKGTKIIYQAHGFHFFYGAPIQNWLFFYPIEKFCSKFTDILITINKEDYYLAKKKFYTKKIYYIPGIGVDIQHFSESPKTKIQKRKELGLPKEAFVLLSVGELSRRKNHQLVIDALSEIKEKDIYYLIAGKGSLYNKYINSAKKKGIGNRLILLGSRNDINELCIAADVFVHPSIREGLGIAPLEGMASGLPLISTYVNGIKDYTKDGITGCCIKNTKDIIAMKTAILKMKKDISFRKQCIENNKKIVKQFDINISKKRMEQIYKEV